VEPPSGIFKVFTTLCSEKNTHLRFLLYLHGKCPDFHKIFRECSGGKKHSTVNKLDILFYWWRHADIIFPCSYFLGFTVEDRHWWNVKTDQLVTVLTEHKNILIPYTSFHFELFSWFIFLAECEILNFADVGKHMRTASLCGWPLACYQLNSLILPVMSIYLFKHYQYSFVCVLLGIILVCVCLPTSEKLRISHSAKKINHENSSKWKLV